MSNKYNNYLFCNFNSEIGNHTINKNELSISDIYNLTTENKVIEPLSNFSDLLEKYFGETGFELIKNNNMNLINTFIKFIPYDYFDIQTEKTITRVFAIDSKYKLFELNFDNSIFEETGFEFISLPKTIINNNKLYIFSNKNLFLMISEGNSPLSVASAPNFVSFTTFQNWSVFALENYKFSIFLAEKTELINIENNINDYVEVCLNPENGEVTSVIVYKNNLYVVQQYSITRVNIKNDDISLVTYCSIQSKIYPETICLIDDYLVFYSKSGLFLFDGNDIKQIFKNVTKNISDDSFKAVSFNNKYYLKTRYYINDCAESVLLQFDIENNYCNVFKFGKIIDLYLIQNMNNYLLNAVVQNSEDSFSILTLDRAKLAQEKKYIKFNKISFDERPIKLFSTIKIESIGKYRLTVTSGTKSISFDIDGCVYQKNIGLFGQFFEIEIESNYAFKIESILVTTSVYSED